MKKVLVVFGTRPEAIKMAPLVVSLKRCVEFETFVCVSAQHREMLDQVLDFFDLTPDFDLDQMRKAQSLSQVTAGILIALESVIDECKPDIILVHGDTNTTISASLSSFYKGIPVGHVEAGLRTGDLYSPWPEEMNRRLTSVLSCYHFAPTERSRDNLIAEGIDQDNIVVTGNTVIDALSLSLKQIELKKDLLQELDKEFAFLDKDKRLILMTGHRRENFGRPLEQVCTAIKQVAVEKDVQILYPVHLNPQVRETVYSILDGLSNVHLIDPVSYEKFTYLMNKSYLILTDSGGIQEEAPSLGKPVLLTRDTSERPEAIDAGTVKLVGTDKEKIVSEVLKLLDDNNYYMSICEKTNPYGDGFAAEKIIDFLKAKLSQPCS